MNIYIKLSCVLVKNTSVNTSVETCSIKELSDNRF